MKETIMKLFAILALLGALGSVAGCNSDNGEPAHPVAGPVIQPTPQAAPITPKRTIEIRNPFGNTEAALNLMADGDFELTGRHDQQPWLSFGDDGQGTLNFETGGHCRSGVRCLVMGPGESIVGWMATPREGKVTVSLWARLEGGPCKDLVVQVVDVDQTSGASGDSIPAPEVDEAGNCHFEAMVKSLPGGAPAVWLELSSKAKAKRVIVDDVVALPASGMQSRSLHFTEKASAPLRLPAISQWIRTHRRFGLPPTTGPENPPARRRDLTH
jgi:hypothetical protein